jgi:uroporphyrinogen decarboxylase
MNSRERVEAALDFRHPDHVPIEINPTLSAYNGLKSLLESDCEDSPAPNLAMEVVPHPDILKKIGVDLISLKIGGEKQLTGELPEKAVDAWGIEYRLTKQNTGQYYEVVTNPLKGASARDLERYQWPEPPGEDRIDRLREQAESLYNRTDLALVGRFGGPILEIAGNLLGMEEWLVRLMSEPEFAADLLKRIAGICTAWDLRCIEEVGHYCSIIKVSGEDLGMQQGPLYPPAQFREIILPALRHRWDRVLEMRNRVGSRAKVMLHSCGSVRAYIPDLIEAGIEVLDPVQPLAAGMDPGELHRDFGGRIVFHGGIDIQKLLPTGSAEDVYRATLACLEGFEAQEGGFILAPAHAIQADTPPENIMAMVKAGRDYKGN